MIKRLLFLTFLISGLPWGAYLGYLYFMSARINDPRYRTTAIMARSLNDYTLKTALLAELMGFSNERSVNLYALNLAELKEKCLRCPAFKDVFLKRIPPSTLLVEYKLRQPIFAWGFLTNTLVDEEGVLFPGSPYFTPKKLPLLYLPIEGKAVPRWGHTIAGSHFETAKEILQFSKDKIPLSLMDLEKKDQLSLGEREIVLKGEGKYIRLPSENWQEGIQNYLKIRNLNAIIADFRVSKIGIIKKL